jgi:hypothetical protein
MIKAKKLWKPYEDQAWQEGWCLDCRPEYDAYYKIYTHYEDPFKYDHYAAQEFVRSKVEQGSKLHFLATFLLKYAPDNRIGILEILEALKS